MKMVIVRILDIRNSRVEKTRRTGAGFGDGPYAYLKSKLERKGHLNAASGQWC